MQSGRNFDLSNPMGLERATLEVSKHYMNEVDLRYTRGTEAFDPTILHVIREVLHTSEDISFAYAGIQKIIKEVKRRLSVHKELQEGKKGYGEIGSLLNLALGGIPGTIIMWPQHGRAIIETGLVTPVFHIAKGFRLVLKHVTVQHVIPVNELMIIESGPAFFPVDVNFQRVRKRNNVTGAFQIHTPLCFGVPDANPYDQRKRERG